MRLLDVLKRLFETIRLAENYSEVVEDRRLVRTLYKCTLKDIERAIAKRDETLRSAFRR